MNDNVNSWMRQAQMTNNPQQQALLYRKILMQIAEDRPMLPIAHSMVTVPVRSEIEGYRIHPTGDRRFSNVRFR